VCICDIERKEGGRECERRREREREREGEGERERKLNNVKFGILRE
jgi:hypothetical protein